MTKLPEDVETGDVSHVRRFFSLHHYTGSTCYCVREHIHSLPTRRQEDTHRHIYTCTDAQCSLSDWAFNLARRPEHRHSLTPVHPFTNQSNMCTSHPIVTTLPHETQRHCFTPSILSFSSSPPKTGTSVNTVVTHSHSNSRHPQLCLDFFEQTTRPM